MQLTDHVWLVGSGGAGFSLTEAHDCHVYLVAHGDDAVLIDAGAGVDPDPLVHRLERTGRRPSRVLITHAHADHCGGAGALRDRFGLRVAASPEVATIMRAGDPVASSYVIMRGPGAYPDDHDYPACEVEEELSQGQRLTIGSLELEVIATPGHSSGHLSYLLHRPGGTDLFSGDAAFGMGRILLQDLWDCSISDSTQSIRTLAALRPDGLFPGHGVIAVHDGWHHLYSAMSDIESGLPPRQLTF